MPTGRVIVVSGPSGAGKTSVMQRVFQTCQMPEVRNTTTTTTTTTTPEPGKVPLVRSVSATTRPPRSGEKNHVDYHFISLEEFLERQKRGEFLESFQVFNQGHWYGTLWSEVTSGLEAGKWVVLEIDVQGALAVMERFKDAITIFIRPSSREELERRLRSRATERESEIVARLERADRELALADRYKYQVINDDMDQAVRQICDIITSEWERSQNV